MVSAGFGQFLAQWPRCPHFRQTSLVGLHLAFALTLLATFALGILSLALVLVLPAVLRGVTKSSARVSLLVTVLLQ